MELWGGHECTVNRVGDRFRDQTILTGHQDRPEDLDRFAALGIRKLRYPVLWERIAPESMDRMDWRWTDERLSRIASLGMEPIAGLTHHGSGPAYTSLVSDDFAPLLGRFAAAAAQRYPDIEHWTPVNEPLTTARFSALYGHWYPHAADDRSFWLALLNQIDATRLAMRAIRQVNPAARLVQTEDLGRYYATKPLGWLADFYNERRWVSWDLLAGRIVPGTWMWDEISGFGLADRLRAIADDPCPPDILGVNHYVTSERFVDHRLADYPVPPPDTGYHDLTAARVLDPPPPGLAGVLREAWQRYAIPLAVTESHLGCTREEQMRWVWQSWHDCLRLADEGVDVRALTAWALIGNVDWSSLLTRDERHYETGPFDIRGGELRPTAIARLLSALGHGGAEMAAMAEHPALANDGWWQRSIRLQHRPHAWTEQLPSIAPRRTAPRPLAITGATGTLGQAFAREAAMRELDHRLTDRRTLPLDDPAQIGAWLDEHRPWAVINTAGYVRVDDAELDVAGCLAANRDGAVALARACAERGIGCVFFSSDLVFDGGKDGLYLEEDAPAPLNVYGKSKAAMEAAVLDACPDALVIRTAAFFSASDPHNFAVAVENTLRRHQPFHAWTGVVTPTFVPDLVTTTFDLLLDGERGIWHLTNGDPVSWADFARQVARALDLNPALVAEASPEALGWRAERPVQASLGTGRGQILPPLADAIARFAADRAYVGQEEQVEAA